jgi:DtxR family transcriptional regulator, Mn-dependent transcriptional regulator
LPVRGKLLWYIEKNEGKESLMEKMSKSHEDYLEAIVMLGGTTEVSVRSVDIAKQMGVSKASVNKAVTALKEKKLAEQPYYGDVTLTQEGYDYATSVYDRHQLLFAFLSKELGIPEEVAEEEACLMEHAISDDSFEKWRAYIKKLDLE